MPPLSARIKLTPKQSVLAEFRGVDLTQAEKALARSAKPVGDLIPCVLKGLGLERKQSELEIPLARLKEAGLLSASDREIVALIAYLQKLGKSEPVAKAVASTK